MNKHTYALKDTSKHKQQILPQKLYIEILHIVIVNDESAWKPKKKLLNYNSTLIIEYIGHKQKENCNLPIKTLHNSEINPRPPPLF